MEGLFFARLPLSWEQLRDSTILLSGASGMIGSFLTDVLLMGKPELNIKIIAVIRNEERAKRRFLPYINDGKLKIVVADINKGVPHMEENTGYVIHAASNTHPRAYATEPVTTILTNIIGTDNMLKCGLQHKMKRFVFVSSVEIYGENRGDTDKFAEDYCGYLDSNTLRAGYPEGKRVGEALCQAYIHEHNADIVLPRLPRV